MNPNAKKSKVHSSCHTLPKNTNEYLVFPLPEKAAEKKSLIWQNSSNYELVAQEKR